MVTSALEYMKKTHHLLIGINLRPSSNQADALTTGLQPLIALSTVIRPTTNVQKGYKHHTPSNDIELVIHVPISNVHQCNNGTLMLWPQDYNH